MPETRSERVILGILLLGGSGACGYGLFVQYVSKVSLTGILYCSVWFVLGAISNLLGLISIIMESFEDESSEGNSMLYLDYHFMVDWLCLIVGYPLMVTFTWIKLYPMWSLPAQGHIILSIIPLLTWIGQSKYGIKRMTQICTGLAAVSHFTVCFLANDVFGYASAVVVVFNIIALTTPTKYSLWAFNATELFAIGMVATTLLMNYSILHLETRRAGGFCAWLRSFFRR